jgi:hypothetical protein
LREQQVQHPRGWMNRRRVQMIRITIAALGLLACASQATAAPQPARSADNVGTAQKAMDECSLNYCGNRSSSVQQARAIWIESCFRQKTGKYPAELGMVSRVLPRCPGSP